MTYLKALFDTYCAKTTFLRVEEAKFTIFKRAVSKD